jgi:regulator of RNase E activity RraA
VTFAGVTFAPGQWLWADRDGVIVADRQLVP